MELEKRMKPTMKTQGSQCQHSGCNKEQGEEAKKQRQLWAMGEKTIQDGVRDVGTREERVLSGVGGCTIWRVNQPDGEPGKGRRRRGRALQVPVDAWNERVI